MPVACSVCEQKSELDYLSAASTSWATHPELLNLLVPVGGAGFEPALTRRSLQLELESQPVLRRSM